MDYRKGESKGPSIVEKEMGKKCQDHGGKGIAAFFLEMGSRRAGGNCLQSMDLFQGIWKDA